MNQSKPKILCLSRSYLSSLLPTLGKIDNQFEYLHIVQTDQEEKAIQDVGGVVVLNIQKVVRSALAKSDSQYWIEPNDMRKVTEFNWSPLYSDRYLINLPEDVRFRIAGALQIAIQNLFDAHKFIGFLSEPVALFVTHLIFYHCKKNNVKPLFWCNTFFSGHFYFAAQAEVSRPVRSEMINGKEAKTLQEKISKYVDRLVDDKAGPIYHYAFSGVKPSIFAYFKQRKGLSPLVLRPGWVTRFIQLARLARAIWMRFNLKRKGDFISAGSVPEHLFYMRSLFAKELIYDNTPNQFSVDNVVYPLQYEPEASLLYFAPHVINQASFVETILKALPHGKLLWVKEHPNQFGVLDSKVWRELKKRYDNLRFVHGRQNGRNLIKKSSLAVTISSTMGMDALLLGRTVLVAGKVYYGDFTGAVRATSYEDLARELNKQTNYSLRRDNRANKSELFRFGQFSYPGDPQPSNYLYDENNLNLLVRAIRSELLGANKK